MQHVLEDVLAHVPDVQTVQEHAPDALAVPEVAMDALEAVWGVVPGVALEVVKDVLEVALEGAPDVQTVTDAQGVAPAHVPDVQTVQEHVLDVLVVLMPVLAAIVALEDVTVYVLDAAEDVKEVVMPPVLSLVGVDVQYVEALVQVPVREHVKLVVEDAQEAHYNLGGIVQWLIVDALDALESVLEDALDVLEHVGVDVSGVVLAHVLDAP
jgi:hypothetical protein